VSDFSKRVHNGCSEVDESVVDRTIARKSGPLAFHCNPFLFHSRLLTYPYQFLSSSSQRYSTLHLITIEKPFVACNPPQEKHGYGSATPSFNEQLASLDSLPLFRSSLPDDPADNVGLSAL